mgnify:CR=1 FL=1
MLSTDSLGLFRKILLCLDGSEYSERPLQSVARLARMSGGSVTLLTVCSPPIAHDAPLATAGHLALLREQLEQLGVPCCSRVAFGKNADTILEVAREEGCDLIVLSSHGRQGRDRFWLGSVAESVMRGTNRTTLIWR